MLLTIFGYILGVIGVGLTLAMVATWRSNLVELQLIGTAALLGGYFALADPELPDLVLGGFGLSFVLTGVLAIVRLWTLGAAHIPYLVTIALAGFGLWQTVS